MLRLATFLPKRALSASLCRCKNPKRPIGIKERVTGFFVWWKGRPVTFKKAPIAQVGSDFNWMTLGLFGAMVVGSAMLLRVRTDINEDNIGRMEKDRKTTRVREFGKAAIGGPFELVNGQTGEKVTQEVLNNKWTLLYFGFNFCPDICPEELEKMSIAYELLKRSMTEDPEKFAKVKADPKNVQGIYISIDPARDTPKDVDEYAKEFNKEFVGFGGTPEQVDHCAKQFRMYYAKAPVDEKFPNDYLVDHSIIIYLMAPDGELEKHFLKKKSAIEIALAIERSMMDWPETQQKKVREEAERLQRKRDYLQNQLDKGRIDQKQFDELLRKESDKMPTAAISRIADRNNSSQEDTWKYMFSKKPDFRELSEGETIRYNKKTGETSRYDKDGKLIDKVKQGGERIPI